MTDLYSKLQFQLTPNLAGLVWITNEELSERPNGFNELDYFFDGLLTHFSKNPLNDQSQRFNKTFFSTEAFGKAFSLTHLKVTDEKIEKELDAIFNVLHVNQKGSRKIAILNMSNKPLKLDNTQFISLSI